MKWECDGCGDLHPSSWIVCPTTARERACEPQPASKAFAVWVAWYFAPAAFGSLMPHVAALVAAAFHAGWHASQGEAYPPPRLAQGG